MNKIYSGIAIGLLSISASHAALKSVMMFYGTGAGSYQHTSGFTDGGALLDTLGKAHGFTVFKTANAADMTYENMKKYDVIVWNNNVGPALTDPVKQEAFIRYMNEGGGYLGIHGAMDHHQYWAWYTGMGVDFNGHQPGSAFINIDTMATKKSEYADIVNVFPKTPFKWDEEWYAFKNNPRVPGTDIILTADESTPGWNIPATQKMGDHAVAWAKKLPALAGAAKQGHYFYMSIGHGGIGSVFKKELYVNEFVYQSLRWTAGEKDGAVTGVNQSKVLTTGKTEAVSVENAQIDISVSESGAHRVDVMDMRGRIVNTAHGNGQHTYVFANLNRQSVYLVKISAAGRAVTKRVFVQ
jgi:hypothetical protein